MRAAASHWHQYEEGPATIDEWERSRTIYGDLYIRVPGYARLAKVIGGRESAYISGQELATKEIPLLRMSKLASRHAKSSDECSVALG